MEEIHLPDDEELLAQARRLGTRLQARQWWLSVAESCTGGWLAKCITDVAGSSGWFERGWVTYSQTAKIEELGVDPAMLDSDGAVSEPVVGAMALGALNRAGVDLGIAISGVAGPGGGSEDKPVGTVCLALATRDEGVRLCRTLHFPGDREAVRRASVARALALALMLLDDE